MITSRSLGKLVPCLRHVELGSAERPFHELLARVHSSATAETSESIHYEVQAADGGDPSVQASHTVCLIHGLLGAGKNLRTISKQLCQRAGEEGGASWSAVLVDQRNHGKSARLHLHPPHDLRSSARDVINLFTHRGSSPEVIIGHSMGGKTTLEIVKQLAAAPGKMAVPKQVWILDAKPGMVDAHSDVSRDVSRVLHAVQGVPLPVPSRQWLSHYLHERGFSPALTQWLGSNLTYEAKDSYSWTFNVEGALQMFESYCKSDYFPLLRAPPPGAIINIVRAAKSDRWDPHSVQAIQEAVATTAQPSPTRGSTRFWELPDAGHWVHVDNPAGLVDMILPSLLEASR